MEEKTAKVRGFIEKTDSKKKKYSPEGGWKKEEIPFNQNRFLVFDTETTTDVYQNLKIGYFEIYEHRVLVENGLFYANEELDINNLNNGLETKNKNLLMNTIMSESEIKTLFEYGKKNNIKIYTKKQFIENVFIPECAGKGTACIGYNIAFDLTRIANGAFPDCEKDEIILSLSDNLAVPKISISRIGLALAYKFVEKGTKDIKDGYFIDASHLYSVLRGNSTEHYTLEEVSKRLKVEKEKEAFEKHGFVTSEYIEYCIGDVKTTWQVFLEEVKIINDMGLYGLPFDKYFSNASVGKRLFVQMGIMPFRELNPKYPQGKFGFIMESFFAGRVEAKLRHEIREVEVLDYTSMYPTQITLQGLEGFIKSVGYVEKEETERIKKFVDSITLQEMLKPSTWKKLVCICVIKPEKDIFPIRTGFDEKEGERTVGLEYLTSEKEMVFTLADVIQSKLLTGKTPKIIKAYTYKPKTQQTTLKPMKILGYSFDPRKEELFKFLVEKRQDVKEEIKKLEEKKINLQEGTSEREKIEAEIEDLDGKQLSLKIIANSLGYGVFVEVNTEKNEGEITAFIGNEKIDSYARHEKPGKYFNPLIGTMITSGARLLLSLAQAKVTEMGFSHYYMDTDSIFVPREIANEVSSFINCLNPYKNIKALLKIEDKFEGRKTDKETCLRYPIQNLLAISSKRYVIFYKDEKEKIHLRFIEGKLHGLGHIINPFTSEEIKNRVKIEYENEIKALSKEEKEKFINERTKEHNKKWHPMFWRDIIDYHRGAFTETDNIARYGKKYEVSKIAIRTPNVLKWFSGFNEEKPYEMQIKPFNFFLRGISEDKNIMPIAPWSENGQEIVNNPFIDAKSGEIKEGKEHFKTMDKTFRGYYEHKEKKFEGNTGILEMRNIFVAKKDVIGKEIDQVKIFEGLEEIEEVLTQEILRPEQLGKRVRASIEAAKKKRNVKISNIEEIEKELIEREENKNLTPAFVKDSLHILERKSRDQTAKYYYPTDEEKNKICEMKIKECRELGLKEEAVMRIKRELKNNKPLNLNCLLPKVLMKYCREEKEVRKL